MSGIARTVRRGVILALLCSSIVSQAQDASLSGYAGITTREEMLDAVRGGRVIAPDEHSNANDQRQFLAMLIQVMRNDFGFDPQKDQEILGSQWEQCSQEAGQHILMLFNEQTSALLNPKDKLHGFYTESSAAELQRLCSSGGASASLVDATDSLLADYMGALTQSTHSTRQPVAESQLSTPQSIESNDPQSGHHVPEASGQAAVAREVPTPDLSGAGDTDLNAAQPTEESEPPSQIVTTGQPKDRTLEYVLGGWLAIVALGVILGFRKTVTVFRNFNDLALSFAVAISPLIAGLVFVMLEQSGALLALAVITLVVIPMVWLLARTVVDNKNPIYACIALITKLSMSVLFILSLINLVTPSGDTARERAAARRSAMMILVLLAPLTLALVRDKEGGIFNPMPSLRRYGVRAS